MDTVSGVENIRRCEHERTRYPGIGNIRRRERDQPRVIPSGGRSPPQTHRNARSPGLNTRTREVP